MLGVNSYSCCSFIQVLGVCRYCFGIFCEVLGVIPHIDEASDKVCRSARVLSVNTFESWRSVKVLGVIHFFGNYWKVLGVKVKKLEVSWRCNVLLINKFAAFWKCLVFLKNKLKASLGVRCYLQMVLQLFEGVRCYQHRCTKHRCFFMWDNT